MKTLSSLNRIGAACAAGLCLLALPSRAASPAAVPAAPAPPAFRPPTFVAPTLVKPAAPKNSPDSAASKAAKKGSKTETATAVPPPPPLILTPGVPVSFQVVETPPVSGFSSQHPGGAQRNRSAPQNDGKGNPTDGDLKNVQVTSYQVGGGGDGKIKTAENDSPRPGSGKSRMSANEAAAAGGLKTIARPAPPKGGGEDVLPGASINISRDNIVSPPNPKPGKAGIVATPPPKGGDGNQPGINRLYGESAFSTFSTLSIVAHGADGKALRYAKVEIQDASGQTIATLKADRKGCVSWSPTMPGKYIGTVTLVK